MAEEEIWMIPAQIELQQERLVCRESAWFRGYDNSAEIRSLAEGALEGSCKEECIKKLVTDPQPIDAERVKKKYSPPHSREMLIEFLMFAQKCTKEKFEEKVLNFARKWGPLDLPERLLFPDYIEVKIERKKLRGLVSCEPLWHWNWAAQKTQTILDLYAQIKDEKPVNDTRLWEKLLPPPSIELDMELNGIQETYKSLIELYRKQGFDAQSMFLIDELNSWIATGRIIPIVKLVPGKKDLFIRIKPAVSNGLYGAIGIQLCLEISGAKAFCQCSGCGKTYHRTTKMPKKGQDNYCERCHETGIDSKIREATYREKKRNHEK